MTLCVYGFIRQHRADIEMPEELMKLCITMYFVSIDAWDSTFSKDHDWKLELQRDIIRVYGDAHLVQLSLEKAIIKHGHSNGVN